VLTIDLTRADSEPLEFSERIGAPVDCGGGDAVAVSAFELSGTIEKASHGYLLTGHFEGDVTLRCVRCLSEFSSRIAEDVELHLLPTGHAPGEDETRLGRDELEVRFYEQPTLDLADLSAEQIELALPMKPLCRPECRGICLRCGANLNEWECACPADSGSDPRFAPLLGWRTSKDTSKES
jgi:uncharacterized protein